MLKKLKNLYFKGFFKKISNYNTQTIESNTKQKLSKIIASLSLIMQNSIVSSNTIKY